MENSTRLKKAQYAQSMKYWLVVMLTFMLSNVSFAQCELACNNNVQVSLDGDCEAEITFDVVLEDPDPACVYTVEVLNLNDVLIPTTPVVTGDYIGQTLKVRVLNAVGNSCWGYIHIEDKLAPILVCYDDLTVSCNDAEQVLDFDANTDVTIDNTISVADPAFGATSGTLYTSFPMTVPETEELHIPFKTENPATMFEYLETLEVILNVTTAPGQTVNVFLANAISSPIALPTATLTNGINVLDYSMLGGLPGIPTTDFLWGDWWLYLEDASAGGVITLNDVEIHWESKGFNSSTFGFIENCSSTLDFELVDEDLDDLDCQELGGIFSAIQTYTYTATDDEGNKAQPCTFTITYERRSLDDVVFPGDTTLLCPNAFTNGIDNWDTNNNEYPDPLVDEAGVPLVDGLPIFPNIGFCEINVNFEDQLIDICPGEYKILRKWTALDWCTSELIDTFQIIKLGPENNILVTTCPVDDLIYYSDPYTCTGSVSLPPPTLAVKTCSDVVYSVSYLLSPDGGATPPSNGFYISTGELFPITQNATIEDLPVGCVWIKYTLYDQCGNQGECFTEIIIRDNIPPFPVCDQFTVVTLTNNGWAQAFAGSFDDGSHDNCTDVRFYVRRMEDNCDDPDIPEPPIAVILPDGREFHDYEKFCCSDVGNSNLLVELLVFDFAGEKNFEFSTDGNGNRICVPTGEDNYNSCMVNVTVQDKLDFVLQCPADIEVECGTDVTDLSITGDLGTILDNCGMGDSSYTDDPDLNSCGVGEIIRTWSVEIGGETKTCEQIIYIYLDIYTDGDIDWPDHEVFVEGCMNADTDPSNTGEPDLGLDVCKLVSATYEDQVFTFADGACFKIIREWVVIDWCLYDYTDGQEGLWEYSQVIKVNNTIDPVIEGCGDREFCAYGEDCDGTIDLTINVSDDCTSFDDLNVSYTIDLFNDGTIDDIGTTNDASGVYPVGEHKIKWTVEDMCGNKTLCAELFDVQDCKNPTPYCLGGITTVIMNDPNVAEVEIWASDFDLGSFDNCTDDEDLIFSFSSDITETNRTYDCDSLGLRVVQVWVTDEAGNQDYCTTMVNIQDNAGICGGTANNNLVSGRIVSENQEPVEFVEITMEQMTSNEIRTFTTTTDGNYAFSNVILGPDYELRATRDDNYLNGVTTLDLVLIQKHILGLQSFDSAFKAIAADVNNSESVTAIDLVELRKLILGIYDELPSNDSWRVVDASQTYPSASQPWPLNEDINLYGISGSSPNNDFIAVKIGDINGSASYNFQNIPDSETRTNPVGFTSPEKDFTSGSVVSMDLNIEEAITLTGFQYAIEFDTDNIEFIGFESASLTMDPSNFGLRNSDIGQIAVSWNNANAVNLTKGQKLFTMNFRAKTNDNISSNIQMTSNGLKAEAYDEALNTRKTTLVFSRSNPVNNALTVEQNYPNPFSNTTEIRFNNPQKSVVTLDIMDISGKIVYTKSAEYNQGMNTIQLDAHELNANGMLYYRLESNGAFVTRKMLIIE